MAGSITAGVALRIYSLLKDKENERESPRPNKSLKYAC